MARSFVNVVWDPALYIGNGPAWDVYVTEIRDAFRASLDPLGSGDTWVVTDITKWQGASTYEGYAFAIFHMNGSGVATGPAWVFFLPGRGSVSGITEIREILQSTVVNDYFLLENNVANTGFTDGGFAIHYCETGATTTPYDAGWNASGALPSGDFTAPTSNPHTNLADFMPGTSFLYGYITEPPQDEPKKWGILFDDQAPVMVFYGTTGNTTNVRYLQMYGKFIEPYLNTDPNPNCTLSIGLNTSDSLSAQPLYEVLYVYNEFGVRSFTGLDYRDYDFTFDFAPLPNGSYAWEPVRALSNNLFKGFLNTNLVRKMGVFNSQYAQMFDNNQFIKYHQSLCFPYLAGEPVFPGV